MRSTLLAALCAGLAATPVAAEASASVAPERIEAFVAVLADHGCEMTEETGKSVMPAAGFADFDEIHVIVGELVNAGRARGTETTIYIYGAPCPDYAGPDVRDVFLRAVAANGCTVSPDQVLDVLYSHDIMLDEVRAILPNLEAEGLVTVAEGRETLSLSEAACETYSAALTGAEVQQ